MYVCIHNYVFEDSLSTHLGLFAAKKGAAALISIILECARVDAKASQIM
mgnify:CR=1 FL=1